MAQTPLRSVVTDHSLMGISLLRLKEHLRILDDDEDALFTQYILAATSYAEEWMGRVVLPATIEAIFNSCCDCCTRNFKLTGRKFTGISKIEVWQDAAYIELTTDQYTVTQETWETFVCIDNDVEIDCTIEDGCQTQPETVKITYTVGETREVNITSIVGAGQIGTTITDAPHGMKTGDIVIQSNTTEDVFNGEFGVTVTGPDSYTFTFVGTPAGDVAVGLATIPIIPPQINVGLLQMVTKMNANKGDCCDECGQVPCGTQKLLRQFRRYIVRGAGSNDCNC